MVSTVALQREGSGFPPGVPVSSQTPKKHAVNNRRLQIVGVLDQEGESTMATWWEDEPYESLTVLCDAAAVAMEIDFPHVHC